MLKKKFVPLADTVSLALLFFLGFYFNIFGSRAWEIFFIISITITLFGGILSLIFGIDKKISWGSFLNKLFYSVYVLAIIIGLNYLFQYLLIGNILNIIEHLILILFFFVLFVLSLREIFINLYLGKRV